MIVIIGCGASKKSTAAPAVDLYTGPLYLARLAYARALGGPHYILSGAHGLVPVDRELEPYDFDLRKQSVRDQDAWANRVQEAVSRFPNDSGKLVVLASGPYLSWTAAHMPKSWGTSEWPWNFRKREIELVPSGKLPLGLQLRWFKENTPTEAPEPEISTDYEKQADQIEAEIARDKPHDEETWSITHGALRILLARANTRVVEATERPASRAETAHRT